MKVLIVNDYANIEGGASNIAVNSAILLSNEYDVTFFAPIGPVDKKLTNSNVKTICLNKKSLLNGNYLRGMFDGLWNFDNMYQLEKCINNLNDKNITIFVHSWTKCLSPSIFRVLLKSNKKIFLVNHDYFSVCPNGGFYFFNKQSKCNLKPLSFSCIKSDCDSRNYLIKIWRVLRQFIFNYYFNKLLILNLKMIYVSKFSEEIISKHIYDKHNRILINNPIFNIKKVTKINVIKNKKIGFIGRLSSEKGALYVAKNLSYIADRIIFIGDGPLRSKIKKINKNFEITGWQNQTELYNQIKKLRAIIFPSLLYETDGLSVKEAGSFGIPAILFDDIAAAKNLKKNHNALIIRKNEINDLNQALIKIYDDKELKFISDNCYDYFNSKDFNKNTFYTKLTECILSPL